MEKDYSRQLSALLDEIKKMRNDLYNMSRKLEELEKIKSEVVSLRRTVERK